MKKHYHWMAVYVYILSILLIFNKSLNNLLFMIPHHWATRFILLYTILNYLRWSHAGEKALAQFLCSHGLKKSWINQTDESHLHGNIQLRNIFLPYMVLSFLFLVLSIGTWDKKVFSLQSKETGKKIYIIEDFVWFKSNLSDDHYFW